MRRDGSLKSKRAILFVCFSLMSQKYMLLWTAPVLGVLKITKIAQFSVFVFCCIFKKINKIKCKPSPRYVTVMGLRGNE